MGSLLLKLAGALLMVAALALTLARAPDRSPESLVARWAGPPSDFIDLGGQLVHLRDSGPRDDPEPLVLLHGTSASLHTWDGWARGLEPRHRVIRFDLPGFGLTGPAAGRFLPADYTPAGDVRFVLALLDALHIERFAIGGNSLGGEIAWHVALAAPQRVARLLLVDSAGGSAAIGSVPLGWRIAATPGLGWLAEQVLPRALVAQGVERVYAHPERITPELVDRYFELTLRAGNRAALGQRLRQRVADADAARIAELKLPTLILWGGQDRLIAPAEAGRFQAAIAGSRLVVFDDLGHVPQEEDPARTLAPLRDFLDGGR